MAEQIAFEEEAVKAMEEYLAIYEEAERLAEIELSSNVI